MYIEDPNYLYLRVNETIDQTLQKDIIFDKLGDTPFVFRNPKVFFKIWTLQSVTELLTLNDKYKGLFRI